MSDYIERFKSITKKDLEKLTSKKLEDVMDDLLLVELFSKKLNVRPFVLEKMTASAAREFMLTAKRFSALEAKDSGLVRFIGHEDEVEDYLTATVEALVENGPQAMRKTKELFSSYREKSVDKNKEFTAEVIAACRVGDEGQEGLNFFLTKEIPKWKAK